MDNDTNLTTIAKQLIAGELFTSQIDNRPFANKQGLFLVLAGCKPISQVGSSHWEMTAVGRKSVGDDPMTVEQFLISLELSYDIEPNPYVTIATVAKTPDLIQQFKSSRAAASVGQLFGYPETAVKAFETKKLLSTEEQEGVEKDAGITIDCFRFSQKFWCDEIKIVLKWQAVLAKYGML